MQLKSLKLFCDIVGRRSFSRAAAENGISQSGASQVVNTLEEELGVKLLDRTRRPFVLTPEGEVYYDGCRKLVQQYFALEEQVRTLHAEVAGRVNVASIYSIGLSHMNHFVQSFLKLHPKANVRVQYQHPHRVYELVETDQVDLGLVSYPRSTRAIKATLWREEPMVLVCSPQHPLAQKERVSLADLHELFGLLRARGLRVAVATADDHDPAVATLAGLGVLDLVDMVVGADDMPTKPAPDPAALELARPGPVRSGQSGGPKHPLQVALATAATAGADATESRLEVALVSHGATVALRGVAVAPPK